MYMLDIKKIKEILFYCYLFLLVDRVIFVEEGKKVIVIKNVIVNEEFFNGYFFEYFVMLGVLIVEVLV